MPVDTDRACSIVPLRFVSGSTAMSGSPDPAGSDAGPVCAAREVENRAVADRIKTPKTARITLVRLKSGNSDMF